jgi:hypothetical protein
MLDFLKDPVVRKRLYEIGVALMGLLAIYGVVNAEQLNAWVVLIGAAVGIATNALAVKNTHEKR